MSRVTKTLGIGAALALTTALPALAQTGLCGGVGDAGQWLGGDEAMSDIATTPNYLEQMALVLMSNEYVGLFTVSSAMEVRVEAEARGAGDTVIDLRDAAGNIVLSDDDSGGNAASFAQSWLEPGTYCLSMRSYDGSPLTGFVRVGRPEHEMLTDGTGFIEDVPPVDDYAYGCDMANISAYFGDGPIDESLSTGGASVTISANDGPYLGFSLANPAAITITASNENADPVIALYDEFGNWLAENDDYDGLNSRIDQTYPLSAGSYCINLTALSDTSLPVDVAITAYDAQAALVGMYERGEASPPLDGSYPVIGLGELGSRLRQDLTTTDKATWFSVDVPDGGLLLIEAVTNGMGDPVLALFDDFGRQIAYNDDYGDSLDSQIAARVLPGTYMVGVWQLGSGTQVLTRMLFQRYVPAQ